MKIKVYFYFKNGTRIIREWKKSEEEIEELVEELSRRTRAWFMKNCERQRTTFENIIFDPSELLACTYDIEMG